MLFLYTTLYYFALPFILLRLIFRSQLQPAYRQRVLERFGFVPKTFEKCLWIHAVSVGESMAALPLIKALLQEYRDLPIVVSTMTPTGAALIQKNFPHEIQHVYLPYDIPSALKRFLKAINPQLCVLMETELWPNLLALCEKKHIPVLLLNARLSAKSAKNYHCINFLTKRMLRQINFIAANGETDAQRFISLGADRENVFVTGNLKFDLEIADNIPVQSTVLRDTIGKTRFVWIAGSTHAGEEEIILAAHAQLTAINPEALLIIVPRHLDRFSEVASMIEKQNFSYAKRSDATVFAEVNVYLGDTMGELLLLYGCADVVFIGGSLVARGGHNLVEPAALAKPILCGPSLFNFTEISQLFLAANAIDIVTDTKNLADRLIYFSQHVTERDSMGNRAKQLVHANRGALAKQLELIKKIMPPI